MIFKAKRWDRVSPAFPQGAGTLNQMRESLADFRSDHPLATSRTDFREHALDDQQSGVISLSVTDLAHTWQ